MTVRRIVPNIRSDTPAEAARFYSELVGLELAMDMDRIVTLVNVLEHRDVPDAS